MTRGGLRLLVITDHHKHQGYESLYPLIRSMYRHEACEKIVVISRAHPGNAPFFYEQKEQDVFGVVVDTHFDLELSREPLFTSTEKFALSAFHQILLRLPKPNPRDWFHWLSEICGPDKIINDPLGIIKTGSKAYLLHFQELCPPIKLCKSIEDVEQFRQKFPLVLKPLNDAGGRGLVKIDGDKVWDESRETDWQSFLPTLKNNLKQGMLAMKYLKRVNQGDKRILVVNGEIVGTSLRLPAADSWLCNVNMGGHAVASPPTKEEIYMSQVLAKDLKEDGVIIFGFDTLEDDDGKRVLSEINASNPGGFYPAQQLSGEPVIDRTAQGIWHFLLVEKNLKTLL